MSNYDFDVVVHNKAVTKYVHEGRAYVEGRAGSEFTLLVCNHTARPVLAVISVDGLSIMDGKTASKDGTGYVVNALTNLKIPGWRLNDESVAKFTFSEKDNSYASQKDAPRNVGVIGCAIFEEIRKDNQIFWDPCRGSTFTEPSIFFVGTTTDYTGSPGAYWSSSTLEYSDNQAETVCDCHTPNTGETNTSCHLTYTTDPNATTRSVTVTPLSSTQPREEPTLQNLGTFFGKKASHSVTTVTFDRKATPSQVFTIHYDDRAGLKARGVNVDRTVHIASPFPADQVRGCTPPVDWEE